MMEMTSGIAQGQDTAAAALQNADAWKNRLIVAWLGLGGVLTVGWCGAITYGAWWLIGRI